MKTPMEYEDGKTKISGDPKDVRRLIWFKMIMKELQWISLAIILLVVLPAASFIPVLLRWFKQSVFMILLVVQVVHWSG